MPPKPLPITTAFFSFFYLVFYLNTLFLINIILFMLTKSDLLNLIVKNIDFQIHEHEPLFTVEDSEKIRGSINGDH